MKRLSERQKNRIVEMKNEGIASSDIARKFKVSTNTVYRHLMTGNRKKPTKTVAPETSMNDRIIREAATIIADRLTSRVNC